jgi:hypothetical protein
VNCHSKYNSTYDYVALLLPEMSDVYIYSRQCVDVIVAIMGSYLNYIYDFMFCSSHVTGNQLCQQQRYWFSIFPLPQLFI